jgi:crossover junction endodeoxyribonuclease RusA
MQATETAPLVIELPLPGRLLSPNGRGHWTAIFAAKQDALTEAKLAARERLLDQRGPYFPAGVKVRITAKAWPRRRGSEMDDDNLKASCKSYWDGFTLAGVWADDRQARWGDVEWQEPTKHGRLILTLAVDSRASST